MNTTMNLDEPLCKDLWGLSFTSPDEAKDRYVHAFSFSREKLEAMIADKIKEEEKPFYSIQPISVYIYRSMFTTTLNGIVNGIVKQTSDSKYNDLTDPLYGFNLITNDGATCEQVLLSTPRVDIFAKDISAMPIQIDTFYEESILN